MASRRSVAPDVDYVPGLTSETNPRRGGTFRTAPERRQEEALSALQSFGERLPERVSAEIEIQKRVASGNAVPEKKKQAEGIVKRLEEFHDALSSSSLKTGMSTSVRAVTDAARMPIEAARLQSRQEGRLIIPEAGLFYPTKYEMTEKAAKSHSSDPSHLISTLIATPQLSALSDPQTELQGGAALSFLKAHGHHGSVTLSDENVRQINDALSKNKEVAPHERVTHSGTHPLSSLPAPVLSALASHYRAAGQGKAGKTSHWFSGATINAPESLGEALFDFGNLGAGGWTKGARAVRAFDNPMKAFSQKSSGGAHKIPSYTLNTIKNSSELYREGVRHHLGLLTHGAAWEQEHPDARRIVDRASALPHWKDPTYTGDVHSSGLASGLPQYAIVGSGDIVRPENLFSGATGLPKTSYKGHPFLTTAADMGYYVGEEAHLRASRSQHFVTGASGLRIPTPAEVMQALGWAGKQAQDKGESLRGIQRASDLSQIVNPNAINQLSPLRAYRA